MVLKDSFFRDLIASGFMSEAVIFFGGIKFSAVLGSIPEPVPMSR